MRNLLACLLFVAITGSAIGAESGGIYSIAPEKPMLGDTIVVRYGGSESEPSPGGTSALRGEALLMMEPDPPVLVPIAMERSGSGWSGRLPLNDTRVRLVLFRVVQGEDSDSGDKMALFVRVYGKNGKPVAGASAQLGSLLASGRIMEFKLEKDIASARAAFPWRKNSILRTGGCTPWNGPR